MYKQLLTGAAAVLLTLTACKEKKVSNDIIVVKPEVFKPEAPIRMPDRHDSKEVRWQGALYTVNIDRTPSDSLPMVQDDQGQQYVDNTIRLTVIRTDGSEFYRRTFTKASFSSYLDDNFRRTGVLEAMMFDEVDDGRLEFAVSVSRPQADDEYIPLEMKLDRDGGLTIVRDDDLDTNGEDDDDD